VKINGTRVDDLIGTGLTTKQRYVIPLWASVLGVIATWTGRLLGKVSVWAVRAWPLTLPATLLLVLYVRFGGWAVTTAVMCALAAGLVWAHRWPGSYSRLVAQRARGGVRWQVRYRRRWHPAMDGTGLTRTTPSRQTYAPKVTGVRSTRVVDTLHVRLLHGQTPLELAQRAEGLRHVYGAHRCTVVEDAPGKVRVIFYARDPLRRVVPAIEPSAVPDLTGLPVGRAENGHPYTLALLGRHVLIAGASGAGKGSVIWSLIRALGPAVHAGWVRLRGVDPKGGMELYPGRALFAEYADEDLAAMVALLEAAVVNMNERKRRLKADGVRVFTPSVTDPLEVIVVDELAFLTAYAPRDVKAKVATALQLLLSQGRAVGFSVVAALQDPRKDVLPFRDLFTYRIALRLAEDAHVDMVLGDGALDRGAACHLIPPSLPGVGFVHVEGASEPVRVRFFWIADDDITAMAHRWPAPTGGGSPRLVDVTTVEPPAAQEVQRAENGRD
jgi:S-DNA-T family DNA segregation ATPase FtsK/SpoIIIE